LKERERGREGEGEEMIIIIIMGFVVCGLGVIVLTIGRSTKFKDT